MAEYGRSRTGDLSNAPAVATPTARSHHSRCCPRERAVPLNAECCYRARRVARPQMRRADIDPRHRLAGILASPSGVPRRGHTHARRVTPTPARPATQITFHDGASMRAVNAARPPVGGSQTRGLENSGRAGGHNRMHNTAVPTTPATVAAHHDRAWWRIEARRVGSDWPAVLVLHAEVVTAWRARHDAGGAP